MTIFGSAILAQAGPRQRPDLDVSRNMGKIAGVCILAVIVVYVITKLRKKK